MLNTVQRKYRDEMPHGSRCQEREPLLSYLKLKRTDKINWKYKSCKMCLKIEVRIKRNRREGLPVRAER